MKIDKDFNPYPGLRSFGPELADFFFGRERQIFQLLRILKKQRFIAVLGSSGSGKSSLVMAGLLPVLNDPNYVKSEKEWLYTIVQPENDPIGNLANSLNRDVLTGMDEEQRAYTNSTLRLDINGIATTLKQAKFKGNLLIVIDQFEELFTHKEGVGSDREEVLMFNQLLLQAARQDEVQIYFVITMRSEYIGRCMELPGLVDLINKSQFLLPVMTRDDYREVIHHPAEKLDVQMNPFFVSSVLNDIEDREDQLPLLQHVLRRSWHLRTDEQKEAHTWPIETYKGIGRLRAALNLHAQSLYDELPSDKHRIACEIMFRRITRQTGKEDGVRVPKTFGHIAACVHLSPHSMIDSIEEARQILGEVFMIYASRDAGMLRMPDETRMKDGMPADDAVVYIMHESLIRKWDLLRTEWLPKETEKVTFYKQMEEAYDKFRDGKGKRLDGTLLGTAIKWKNTTLLNEAWVEAFSKEWHEVIDFIRESERRRRIAFLIRRGINIAMGIGLVILFSIAVYVYFDAEKVKAEAEKIKAHVAVIEADRLAAGERADSLEQSISAIVDSLHIQLDSARAAEEQAQMVSLLAKEAKAEAERVRMRAEEAMQEANRQRYLAEINSEKADSMLKVAEANEKEALELAAQAQEQSLNAIAIMDSAIALLDNAQQQRDSALLAQAQFEQIEDEYNTLLAAKEKQADANILINYYLVHSPNWTLQEKLTILHAADSLDPGNSVVERLAEVEVFPLLFATSEDDELDFIIAGEGEQILCRTRDKWELYDPEKNENVKDVELPALEASADFIDKPFIISLDGRYVVYKGEGQKVVFVDLETKENPVYTVQLTRKASDIGALSIDELVYFDEYSSYVVVYLGDNEYEIHSPDIHFDFGRFKVSSRRCESEPCELALTTKYILTVAGNKEAGQCFQLKNGDELPLPETEEVKSVIALSRDNNKYAVEALGPNYQRSKSKLSTRSLMNFMIYKLDLLKTSPHMGFVKEIIEAGHEEDTSN